MHYFNEYFDTKKRASYLKNILLAAINCLSYCKALDFYIIGLDSPQMQAAKNKMLFPT